MSAFTDKDYENMVAERDEARARCDEMRGQIMFYRNACTARFLPQGFGDETMRTLIDELTSERDEARAEVDRLRGEYQYSIGLSMALEERNQLREQVATLNANVDTFLAELDQARDQRDKAEDDLARSLAAWESAGMQGRDAQQAMLELSRQLENARREADRFRHGCTVEGDFVCPNEQAYTEARASRWHAIRERDEARTELAGLADALDDIRHQRDRYHAELKQERQEVERLRKGLEPIADGTVWNAKESAEFLLRRKP